MLYEVRKAIENQVSGLHAFLQEPKNRRTAGLLLALFIGLALCALLRDLQASKAYLRDEAGHVIGIVRESTEGNDSYPLLYRAEKGSEEVTGESALTFRDSTTGSPLSPVQDDPLQELRGSVQAALGETERQSGRKVLLPTELDDGTSIEWSSPGWTGGLALALLGPFMILLLYVDAKGKGRRRRKEQADSITAELPAFSDQLVLLLRSGLTVPDAFARIADGYSSRRSTYFRRRIGEIREEAEGGARDWGTVLRSEAEKEGNRLFSRFAGILAENQRRGIDLTARLENESGMLWQERRNLAEERGKEAEVRMTIPLASLLIVLILITAAPAILQAEGGY